MKASSRPAPNAATLTDATIAPPGGCANGSDVAARPRPAHPLAQVHPPAVHRNVTAGAEGEEVARGIAAALRGMAERPEVTAMLGQIRCPTLVLVGRLDRISPPEEMRAIADAIPDARFVPIAQAGHMSPMENPEDVNAAMLSFLAEIADGA